MSTPDTAIVIAAGHATRWGDYRGTPKHLIEVDGEPILHRTVRLPPPSPCERGAPVLADTLTALGVYAAIAALTGLTAYLLWFS